MLLPCSRFNGISYYRVSIGCGCGIVLQTRPLRCMSRWAWWYATWARWWGCQRPDTCCASPSDTLHFHHNVCSFQSAFDLTLRQDPPFTRRYQICNCRGSAFRLEQLSHADDDALSLHVRLCWS